MLPLWLEIVIAIVGVFGTIFGILGVTSYISKRMEHKAEQKNKKDDEIYLLKYNGYKDELKTIIDDALIPIKKNLSEVKEDLILVKKGTQATCRNDLEEMFAIAEKQGYCSNEDKQKFEAAYQAYHMLGKNGVMDAKREKLLAMPEHKIKKQNSRKVKASEKTEGD